MVDHRRLRR